MKRKLFLFMLAALTATLSAMADEYIKVSNRKMSFNESWKKAYTYFNDTEPYEDDAYGSNATDIEKAYVEWDATNRKLTLFNIGIFRGNPAYLAINSYLSCMEIISKQDVTIELLGKNVFSTERGQTLELHGNTTFIGDGELHIGNWDSKKPAIDLCEENLTLTVDGPFIRAQSDNNATIRGKNNTSTLHMKSGTLKGGGYKKYPGTDQPLMKNMGNVIFDYGMGVQEPHGVAFSPLTHSMTYIGTNKEITHYVDRYTVLGPIKWYGLRICGKEITENNYDCLNHYFGVEDGFVCYYPEYNELLLKHSTINNERDAPTIENYSNEDLTIKVAGENKFEFFGDRERKGLYLKKNTTVRGYDDDKDDELKMPAWGKSGGIYVAPGRELKVSYAKLTIPELTGGNASSHLFMGRKAHVWVMGSSNGSVRSINVVNQSSSPDVAVANGFIYNRTSVPGVYTDKNTLATGSLTLSTLSDVIWYPITVFGTKVNNLNRGRIVNEYVDKGYMAYEPEYHVLNMYHAKINYTDNYQTDPAIVFNPKSNNTRPLIIGFEGENTVNTYDKEFINCSSSIIFRNFAINNTDPVKLTLSGSNAKVSTGQSLSFQDMTAIIPEIEAYELGGQNFDLNVTRQQTTKHFTKPSDVTVASTPDAPAYYDSQDNKLVSPLGPVHILPSSEVTVYDGIKFCGEEINSANHTCVMNKYVDEGSLSVEKVSNGYTVSMHGITVKSENDVDIFNFTSLGTVGLNLYGHFNIFDTKGHFIKGDAKNIYIYGKEKDGVENCLMVEGSSTSNAGAVSVAANSSLYIYKGDANNLYVSVPRIYGQGTTSKLYVNDPYLYVRGFQRGTVSNITCAMTTSKVELYNTSSSPREIRSDGIYENGSLCTGEVKFVGKGESYIPVEVVKVYERELKFDTKGQTAQLTADVYPEDATNKNVVWVSNDETVAKVDQKGKVTAVGRGLTMVAAISEEMENPNSFLSACIVRVEFPEPTAVTLSETDVLIDREGIGGFYLTANLTPSNAETDNLEWESSDTTLVTVLRNSGKTALVRRVGDEGQATITVKTANGLSASCNVTVHYPITPWYVEFAQRTYTLTEVGEQLKLEPIVTPDNCEKLSFTWYTSSDAISLSNDGTVTARRNGSAVVECWACYDGQKWAPGEVRINVEIPPTPVIATGLTLSPASSPIFYSLGERLILTPVFTPEDVTSEELTWKSSNESVATVDENGFVTIVGWGDCDITATTTDGSNLKASHTINAIDPSTLPEPVYATGIKLSDNEVTLMRGEEAHIGVTIEPANYTESVMVELLEGDLSIAEAREEWDWNTNQTSIYIRSDMMSEQFGDVKYVVRPNAVDWEKLNAMGIWEEPKDTITIHVLAPIIFAEASPEDISITYHVTDINDKTCEVYTQSRPGMPFDPLDPDLVPAVSTTATGKLTVPARANGYWVTNVMPCAFNHCTGLTDIEFSEGIESIGDYACYSALFSLERVTLPSTITELGYSCFSANPSDYATSENPSGRNNLREVNIKAFTPPTGQNGSDISMTGAFQSVAADAVLYVPTGALANYNVEPWTYWFSRIEEKQFFEDYDGIRDLKDSKDLKDLKDIRDSWYTLDGRMVSGQRSNGKLPKGLYIKNGKKVVVK